MAVAQSQTLPQETQRIGSKEIRAKLEAWWQANVAGEQTLAKPKVLPVNISAVSTPHNGADSLAVLDALLELEALLGGTLPAEIVRIGGYRTCEEMVTHLLRGLGRLGRIST